MPKIILVVFALLTLWLKPAFAQVLFDDNRFVFGNNNYSLINPAFLGAESKSEVLLQRSSYTGIKKVINTTNLQGSFSLNDAQRSYFGFQLQNHSEGIYIDDNSLRLLFNYNILPETAKSSFVVGLTVGLSNLYIESNGTSKGGSSWGPSSSLGALYDFADVFKWGLSYVNIIGSSLNPIVSEVRFPKKIVNVIDYKIHINEEWLLQPALVSHFYENRQLHQLIAKILYSKMYYMNFGVSSKQDFVWGVGIENLKVGQNFIKVAFGSNLFASTPLNSNKYEWLLSYYFK